MKTFKPALFFLILLTSAIAADGQTINVSTTAIDFEEVYPGYHSRVKTYTVSASGLNDDLSIQSPQGYQISENCTGNYSNDLVLQSSGNITSKKIYVKFTPQSSGIFTGNITHQSVTASVNISVNETTGSTNIPSGYYNAAISDGSALKTELHNIIDNHTVRSYSALWSDYQSTDVKSNGKVWDMYTDNGGCITNSVEFTFISDQCGNYSAEGDCYNREHSIPKSWFNDASPMNTDLYHVVPSDGYSNGMRSNYPFGETSTANYTTSNGSMRGNNNVGTTYTGYVFEPADIYKGDFARIYFYMATRYEDQIASWENNALSADVVFNGTAYPVFEPWYLDMLARWHFQDPVSQKEIKRNDEVYNLQGNRNPYVDRPEYVVKVWGDEISILPEPDAYPSGFNATATNSSVIEIQWSPQQSVISPDGWLVKANNNGMFVNPVDGIDANEDFDLSDGEAVVKLLVNAQNYIFQNLQPSTVYYFKIWPFTNDSNNIDYKITPDSPQDSAKTDSVNSGTNLKFNSITGNPYMRGNQIFIDVKKNIYLEYQLYDYSGRLLGSYKSHNEGVFTINTSAFHCRFYILSVRGRGIQKNYKLLSR
ncbi:MAG: endonuclease [Bacteroidales bacterium]|nr:endonuclease [Bacteroidales bacterium]